MSAGKILALIFGILFLIIGVSVTVSGIAVLAVNNVFVDDQGYFTSPEYQLTKEGAVAVTFSDININIQDSSPEWVKADLGNIVRIRLSLSSAEDYFIGVGQTADVEKYLANVSYAKISDFNWNSGLEVSSDLVHAAVSDDLGGNKPAFQTFWNANGSQNSVLEWVPEQGSWTFVVMKADGTEGIDVGIKGGAKVPILGAIGTFLVIFGVLFVVLAIVMFIIAARSDRTRVVTVNQYVGPSGTRTSEVQQYVAQPTYGTPSPKAQVQQEIPKSTIETPSGNEEVYVIAEWGPRILAFIIDAIVVSIIVEMFKFPIVLGDSSGSFFLFPSGISVNGVALFVYFLVLESYYGTTLGKEALKLQVITEDGRRPEPKEADLSAVGKAFFLPIDFLVGVFVKDQEHDVPMNQRLMQKVSKTLVIVKPMKK
jgi:uncharacterized RDD family membrane protein YckC